MFGRNVIPYAPIAPAEKIISEATSDASCPPFTLKQTGGSFLTTVRVGDLIVRTSGTGAPVSAYVVQVVSNTELILDEDLSFNSNTFDSLRPSILPLRAPEGLEWIMRSIRCPTGDSVYRVGVWFSDNKRRALLLDTKRLYARLGLTGAAARGFWLDNQDILVGYRHIIQIRNYTEETLDVVIYGVNKTVDVPQG